MHGHSCFIERYEPCSWPGLGCFSWSGWNAPSVHIDSGSGQPQPGANQFRFSPLQRRQRHCDRIAFPIWVVDGPSISRLAVIAICRQRLAPLILGRESSDMGGLLLPWATTNGVEGSWMVATPGKRSRAGGTEAQWGDDFRQPTGDFRLPTRRTDPYPTSKLHDSVGWQLRGPRRSSSDLLSVSG